MKDRERRSILCTIYNLTPYVGKNTVEKKIFSSVQFSHPVVSDSLQPHGLQQTRSPCPSPTPWVYSNSCHWISDAIQPSHPLSSPSPPAFNLSQQQVFQMSQFFASGGQNIGVSASVSVLPMNIQDWFPLGWTGWISLQSKGLSRVFSNTTVQKHQFFSTQLWPDGLLSAKQCLCFLNR